MVRTAVDDGVLMRTVRSKLSIDYLFLVSSSFVAFAIYTGLA